MYKSKAYDFSDTKASVLGDYIAAKLGMDEDEVPVSMIVTKDYEGFIIFAFENGKLAKVPLNVYATKTNRKKLTGAYSDKSPLSGLIFTQEDCEVVLTSTSGRMLLIHTGVVSLKTTRNTQGIAIMKLKKGHRLFKIEKYVDGQFADPKHYRSKTYPTMGAFPRGEDAEGVQLSLTDL